MEMWGDGPGAHPSPPTRSALEWAAKEGDRLGRWRFINTFRRTFIDILGRMTDPQLLGFLLGDGYAIYNKARKSYDVGFEQSIRKNWPILAVYTALMTKTGNKIQVGLKKDDKMRVYIYSRPLYYHIKELRRTSAETFMAMKDVEKLRFIAGFFDAEGSITAKEISLYNKDKELLDAIVKFLRSNEISCLVRPCKNIFRVRIRSKSSRLKFIKLFSRFSIKLMLRKSLLTAEVKPRRGRREG